MNPIKRFYKRQYEKNLEFVRKHPEKVARDYTQGCMLTLFVIVAVFVVLSKA